VANKRVYKLIVVDPRDRAFIGPIYTTFVQ